MAKLIKGYWPPTPRGSGLGNQARRGCNYEAYAPDPLVGRPVVLPAALIADVTEAERAIAELDHTATALVNTEALARLLLRAESVNSSKIEGLEVSARRLLRAAAARAQGNAPNDITAIEVLGNIDAMSYAIDAIDDGADFSIDLLLEVHRRLLHGTPMAKIGGNIRETQNWIGGSSYNPCSASFVPPPPQYVVDLLNDLCAYCNVNDTSPLVQAALAHSQFEAIHPFADGNGRVGRALIHMVFRRRRLTSSITPPISLVLATISKEYISGLNAMCYRGAPTSAPALTGLETWIGTFAAACTRAVQDSFVFERRIQELQSEWKERVGRVRSDSMVPRLLAALPGTPIITAAAATTLLHTSLPSAIGAIDRLVSAGILRATTDRQRQQIYEAREIIDIFTSLERRLASPAGNTRISPPVRRVPVARKRKARR